MGNIIVIRGFVRSKTKRVVPECYDELSGWCSDATRLAKMDIFGESGSFWRNKEFLAMVHHDSIRPEIQLNLKRTRGPSHTTEVTENDLQEYDSRKAIIVAINSRDLCGRPDEDGQNQNILERKSAEMKIMGVDDFCDIVHLLRRLELLHCIGFVPCPTCNGHAEEWPLDHLELKCSQQHQTVCNHDADDKECSVCMDETVETVLPCLHGFCQKCTRAWVKQHLNCPVCRQRITKRDYEKEQWQMETWSKVDATKELRSLGARLDSLSSNPNITFAGLLRAHDFVQVFCTSQEWANDDF